LGQPQIDMPADPLPRKGERLNVGNAVDPDRVSTIPATYAKCEVAWCSPSGDDHARPFSADDPQKPKGQQKEAELVPARGIVDNIEPSMSNLGSVGAAHRHKGDILPLEGRQQPQQLHPVAAARRDGKNPLIGQRFTNLLGALPWTVRTTPGHLQLASPWYGILPHGIVGYVPILRAFTPVTHGVRMLLAVTPAPTTTSTACEGVLRRSAASRSDDTDSCFAQRTAIIPCVPPTPSQPPPPDT